MRICLLLLLTLVLPGLAEPLTPAQKKEARAIYQAYQAIETQVLKLPLKPGSEAALTRLYDEADSLMKRSNPLPPSMVELGVVGMEMKNWIFAQRALALYDPNHVAPPGFQKSSLEDLEKDVKARRARYQSLRDDCLQTLKTYGAL